MAYTLTASVHREIERVFAPEHWDYVRLRLAEQALPLEQSAPPPRVHLAVIWLSKGERRLFDSALQEASCDWRDTLVAAGLANEGWKDILKRQGIDFHDW